MQDFDREGLALRVGRAQGRRLAEDGPVGQADDLDAETGRAIIAQQGFFRNEEQCDRADAGIVEGDIDHQLLVEADVRAWHVQL